MESKVSVNNISSKLVRVLCDNPEVYNIDVYQSYLDATVIDAGITAKGGYSAGKIITEICLGGLGKANIQLINYDDLALLSIVVTTDHPIISTLGSQLAGWQISIDDYRAIGSGPARALSLKPKKLYDKIEYSDKSEIGIIFLETTQRPSKKVIDYISNECQIKPEKLYIITAPTSSIVGSIQISGRIVETAIHKLIEIGFDPNKVLNGFGYSPIAPIHPKFLKSMGRTNDAIIFGGVVYLTLRSEEDDDVEDLINKIPANTSDSYGKPFFEIFEEAKFDFYKIDPGLFAPALITINDLRTGKTYEAGKIDTELLKRSFNI